MFEAGTVVVAVASRVEVAFELLTTLELGDVSTTLDAAVSVTLTCLLAEDLPR